MYKCDQYPDSVLVKKKSSASGVLELVAKPVEAFVEAVTRGGAGCLKWKKVTTFVNTTTHFGLHWIKMVTIPLTWMYQFLFLRLWRPSLSVISAAFMAFGRSCLFAKINRTWKQLMRRDKISKMTQEGYLPPPSVRPLQAFASIRPLPPLLFPCKKEQSHQISIVIRCEHLSLLSTTKISPWVFWK